MSPVRIGDCLVGTQAGSADRGLAEVTTTWSEGPTRTVVTAAAETLPPSEAWPLPLVDRCYTADADGGAGMCINGFLVADIPYAISCAQVLEEWVTPTVVGIGALPSFRTPTAEVHLIEGVEPTTMVAVRIPSIPCTDTDPVGVEAWHMRFPDDAHTRVPDAFRAALCTVLNSTPEQAQANGC